MAEQRSLKGKVSDAEWQVRVDLAACYRLIAHFHWDDLVFTHVTARVPGTQDQFLINPYGMLFDEITASSLVRIDLQGNKLDASPWPVNPAGFTIHSAIHSVRHDAACVLHTHTLNGVAVSAQKNGVLPISQQSIFVLASLAYHGYEGLALRDDEKPRLVRDLGDKTYLMLRNHGLLTVGPSVTEAFLAMYVFESTCTIQIRAMAGASGATGIMGDDLVPVDPRINSTAGEQAKQVTKGLGGMIVWPGLLRRLDRIDPSYRT